MLSVRCARRVGWCACATATARPRPFRFTISKRKQHDTRFWTCTVCRHPRLRLRQVPTAPGTCTDPTGGGRTTRNLGSNSRPTSARDHLQLIVVPSTRTRSQKCFSPTEMDVSAMVSARVARQESPPRACSTTQSYSDSICNGDSICNDPIQQRLHALQPRAARRAS